MSQIKIYVVALIAFLLIDMVWLGIVAKNFYKSQIGFIMAPQVNWTAAIIFYCIFVAGVVFFVINPALAKDSLPYALLTGGLFGFITYATYDLTNLATLKDWPLVVTVVDLIWGTFLSSATATLSFLFIRRFLQ